MSAMSLPIALYFLAKARRVRKCLYVAILGALSFAIIVSGSRVALLAGAIVVVYMLAVSPSLRRKITPLALSIGVMVLASTLVVASETSESALARLGPGSLSAVRSDARRDVVRSEALRQIEARPLTGVGFGSIEGAHSNFLQFLQSGGVLAILAFLLFVGGAVRTGLRLGRRARTSERRGLALALLGSIGALLVAGVASNDVAGRGLYVPVGLIAALAMIERREKVASRLPATPSGRS